MAVRSTMTAILARVRFLINDQAGPNQVFSDQEIQDIADSFRDEMRYYELSFGETILPGGNIVFLDYYSTIGGDWEPDGVFQCNTWATVVPDSQDWLVGKWSFIAQPKYPIYLTGKRYDVYRISAELLENWAGKVKFDITFSSQGQSFSRSEKINNLMSLAKLYRSKQQTVKRAMNVRSDISPYQ